MPPDLADDLVIEIPPNSITVEIDADGTPKTVPVEPETPSEPETPDPTLAELEQARRERDDLVRRAEQAERTAQERERALAAAQAATETERSARSKAEATAHDRTVQGAVAHYYRINSELENAKSALGQTQTIIAQAEANLAAAHADGDHTRIARINSDVARANAEMVALQQAQTQWGYELDRAKRAYEDVAVKPTKTEEPKPEPKTEVATSATEPDKWIAQFPKKTTGDWLRSHREYVTDTDKHKKLMDFANEWYNEGNSLHTKDFIKALDQEFGFSTREETTTVTTETPKKEVETPERTRPKATPAAPVSRGSGDVFSSSNLNAAKVKLPADVVAFCKQAGLDPTSYALSVVEEIKRGEKPKEWLDPSYDRGIR
jgi:hypothetical protein